MQTYMGKYLKSSGKENDFLNFIICSNVLVYSTIKRRFGLNFVMMPSIDIRAMKDVYASKHISSTVFNALILVRHQGIVFALYYEYDYFTELTPIFGFSRAV